MAHRDVFISYSKPDTEAARQLVAQLEAHGTECWYAGRDVPAGMDWPAEIVHAIGESRVMVLIFSAAANQSPQVRREVILAMERNVRVVPFRIEDVTPSESLEYFLSGQQWIDAFPPPLQPHCARLIVCLDSIPSTTRKTVNPFVEPPNPPPAPPPIPEPRTVEKPDPLRVRTPPSRRALEIESTKLVRVKDALAYYIGPIANWKVDCAYLEIVDPDAFIACLGDEIESERDRTKFTTSCRQLLA